MRYLFLLLFFTCTSGQLMAAEMTSRDFAAGYYLETSGTSAVYSVALPEDIYRTIRSGDLNDIAVFNGAGEVVPHQLRVVASDPATLRDKEAIPFFPLLQQADVADNQAEISFQVSRDATGALVNIQSGALQNKHEKKITGYLLDLSHSAKAVSELVFSWQNDLDSDVFIVDIVASNDLERWTPLVHRATLADLHFAGQQVQRKSIQLPNRQMKYLKLSWQKGPRPLNITAVTGFSAVLEARKSSHWLALTNGSSVQQKDLLAIDFSTDYRLPTSSVQIGFAQANSIAMLAIQSRAATDKAWQPRCEQVFHDLSVQGTTIRNEPCTFLPTKDALWRVLVQQDGAGLQTAAGALTLQLGWQPSELLFVGRGMPPYLLAFGSGKIARQDKDQQGIIVEQVIKADTVAKEISQARIGKKIILSGDLALQEPAQAIPWQRWLLWSVLVLGVGLLFFMARSLFKEMKTADEKRVAGK